MNIVLSANNLCYSIGSHKVLDRVNFYLPAGESLFVCGSSGQGKSTLLRLLAGLEKPDMGVVRIFDQDIQEIAPKRFDQLKTKLGFVFQNSALISHKTVWENVALPLIYHNLESADQIKETVDNTLEMLLIKQYQNLYPSSLSLGIQKRAAIARAIVTRPQLIMMDEPTIGLDRISRGVLLALISNIIHVNHVAMIIVTHDLFAARELKSKIGVLKDGELLEPMEFEQLHDSQDTFVAQLFNELQLH